MTSVKDIGLDMHKESISNCVRNFLGKVVNGMRHRDQSENSCSCTFGGKRRHDWLPRNNWENWTRTQKDGRAR